MGETKLTRFLFLSLLTIACGAGNKDNASRVTPNPESAIASEPLKLGLQAAIPHTFSQALYATPDPQNDKNWIIVQQSGQIYRANQNDKILIGDVSANISAGGERGLLGLAFHPQLHNQAYVFLSYTANEGRGLTSFVRRYNYNLQTGMIDTSRREDVISVAQPYGNHNGGQIEFGPDGMLYIGWGDGGSGGDPKGHGQNTQTLLGTLLRIDVNRLPYTIPADNPYVEDNTVRSEIYAYGLRNPWRWSFDVANGDLWLADVGQNAWEEINLIEAGGNYGWNIKEGSHCYNSSNCNNSGLKEPVYDYPHSEGQSVTGGYVYRGAISTLHGKYIFGDFITGKIWALNKDYQNSELLDSKENIASFAQDTKGEVYLMSYSSGKLLKLVAQ